MDHAVMDHGAMDMSSMDMEVAATAPTAAETASDEIPCHGDGDAPSSHRCDCPTSCCGTVALVLPTFAAGIEPVEISLAQPQRQRDVRPVDLDRPHRLPFAIGPPTTRG